MVDSLIKTDDSSSIANFLVTHENIFVKDGVLQEAGLIENIAQTAALRSGYLADKNNSPIKKGFIGAVKKLQIRDLPEIGDILTTTIQELNLVLSASIISGKIEVDGKLMAKCEMTIFTED